jgi:2-dehydro-3-deoxyphosphogluconate aldolase/(4S)-4-hydroxy-2-oxoglutarate aldolase
MFAIMAAPLVVKVDPRKLKGRAALVDAIASLGVIAVVRLDEAARLKPVAEALAAGEVCALEITMTIPGALTALEALSQARGDALLLGAGTVLDAETARLAILAGARFVVAPTLSLEVVAMCHRYDVVAIPGGYTPTEILTAWTAGADLVKVFPARGLSPQYLKDLRTPLPQLRLVPTGGVTAENAGAYLEAGAVAVGVGGKLIAPDAVARGDWGRITEEARRLMGAVRQARAGAR